MRDHRTELEKDLHGLILEISETIIELMPKEKQWGRVKFVGMLGRIRTARVHLDNKQLGCLSGLHASECYCEQGIQRSASSKERAA